jgi:hypothetical protein
MTRRCLRRYLSLLNLAPRLPALFILARFDILPGLV